MVDTIDLTGDGGVTKMVLRSAKPGALAPSEDLPLVDGCETILAYDTVIEHGTLAVELGGYQNAPSCSKGVLAETGEVFDTTREDNTIFSFEVGNGAVIKAWDIALKTMKVGELAKITCNPEYAYGIAGSPPDIPPNATLIFEVELVACRPHKGLTLSSVSEQKAKLEELKKQREMAAAAKDEEKKRREEAKAAAAARVQAKMESKKGQGRGKGKAK